MKGGLVVDIWWKGRRSTRVMGGLKQELKKRI